MRTGVPAVILGAVLLARGLPAQQPAKIDFARDVDPLFRAYCYGCHGPAVQSNNFRLDRRADSLPNRVGANGARVVPGNSAASRLYLRLTGQAGLQMPPTGPLSAEQIGVIKAWIDQGAEWPDELAGDRPSAPQDPAAGEMMEALRRGDRAAFERLLRTNPKAARGRGTGGSTPLMAAALYGDVRSARLLLENGADANARNDAGATALLWAVDDAETTRLLLEHGADPNTRSADGRAPVELAAGSVVKELLLERGASAGNPAVRRAAGPRQNPLAGPPAAEPGDPPANARSTRQAVEKSLPLLQKADVVFLRKSGCVSCHNNSLTEMTLAVARKRGFAVDEAAAQAQLDAIRPYLESWRERVLQDIPIPGGIDTIGYILAGIAAANYPPDAATDALARYVKRRQMGDGGWRIATQRPPLESSDIEASAIAVRALQVYAPRPQQADYANAIRRGAAWLGQAEPKTTEDFVYRLVGLGWAGDKEAARQAARELMERQRPDGGWAQLPMLASDAYATGEALTALAEAGDVAAKDPVYQRGVRFLLSAQLADGSWHVRTRAVPVQPYFDSEFPHGRDQFISAAATNWATRALLWGMP